MLDDTKSIERSILSEGNLARIKELELQYLCRRDAFSVYKTRIPITFENKMWDGQGFRNTNFENIHFGQCSFVNAKFSQCEFRESTIISFDLCDLIN